jgi:AcrR family transcriptional regulator
VSPENLRIRRTRKLLRDALIELIEERGFDRLTVSEVTERAMVSRAAFYRNYDDKFHLVEQIFDEAMAELLGTMTVGDAGEGRRSTGERWVGFFEHIAEYHRFYGALLGRRGSSWFAAKMRAALSQMAAEHLPPPAAPGTDGLAGTVLGGLLTESVTWWLDQGMPSPPRVIAGQSAQLAGAVIAVAGTWADADG